MQVSECSIQLLSVFFFSVSVVWIVGVVWWVRRRARGCGGGRGCWFVVVWRDLGGLRDMRVVRAMRDMGVRPWV